MKRFLLFVLIPFTIIAITIWSIPNLELPAIYFYTSLAALLVFHQIVWIKSIVNKKMTGEVVLRRIKKKFFYNNLILAILVTVLYSANPNQGQSFLPIGFWFLVIIECINYFMIKSFRPDAMAINGQILYVDFYYLVTRDLTELSCLKLNGFNNRVEMVFTKKSSLYFYGDEFAKEDLKAFISYAISKSQYEVAIADNLQHFLNTETALVTR